jgi:transposase
VAHRDGYARHASARAQTQRTHSSAGVAWSRGQAWSRARIYHASRKPCIAPASSTTSRYAASHCSRAAKAAPARAACCTAAAKESLSDRARDDRSHSPLATDAQSVWRAQKQTGRLSETTGLPLLFRLSPANVHDAPFARPLLDLAVRLLAIRPHVIRLDAGYWGLQLIAWIHTTLGARAVIPWNPKRQKKRDGLPPTWTAEELGKRTSIERFFGRVLLFFHLQRPPVFGWSAVESRVALTYAAVWVVALAAWQAGHPDLIRSPRRVLAHVWEGMEM